MISKVKLFFFFCFLSFHYAFAMDFRKGALDKNLKIKPYEQEQDSLVREIEVLKDGKSFFLYRPEMGQLLVESGLVKPTGAGKNPILVSIWHKGAHSQIMQVFDLGLSGRPEEKEILRCRITSAWPMRIDVNETRLVARTTTSDIDPKTGIPKEEVKTCEF